MSSRLIKYIAIITLLVSIGLLFAGVPLGLVIVALVVTGLAVCSILILPPYLVDRDRGGQALETKDLVAAENSVRATLIQALGGLFFLVTIFLTWTQLHATQQQQLTDRFTSAIGLLGNKDDAVRLGGIFSLGRIAEESKTDRQSISETLTAYVRKKSPWQAHRT
jgi:hypothetical protein